MPDGTALAPEPTAATTVVGIGTAGCRMLQTVADVESRTDPDLAVEYVAIDTDPSALGDHPPAGAREVRLEFPDRGADVDQPDYLNGLLRPQGGGTARRRPLGRYAVDNPASFDGVYRSLEDVLRATHERETANGTDGAHQVWVLFGFGGGTGSGALPMVAAMVDDVLTGLQGATALGVLGSLPRLDSLEQRSAAPAGSVEFYVNAYTTLRELAVLLGLDEAVEFPVTVTAPSTFDSELMAADGFEMAAPPIDACGLLAVREAAPQGYREIANEVAASVVFGFASQPIAVPAEADDGVEWPVGPSHRLFSVDGSEVVVPVEDVRRYAAVVEELAETTDAIDRLGEEATELKAGIDFLRAALGPDPLAADSPLSVAAPRVESLLDRVQSGPSVHEVERTIENVAADLDAPAMVDPEFVAEFVVTDAIDDRLTEAIRERHSFPTELEDVVEQYRDVLDLPADLSGTSPATEWEEMVRPTLRERCETLTNRRESTAFVRVFEHSRLESEIETLERRLDELDSQYEAYRSRASVEEAVDDRRRQSRERLRRRRAELEDRLDEVRDRRGDLLDERSHLQHRQSSIERRLAAPDDSPYRMQVPVTDVPTVAKRLDAVDPGDLAAAVEANLFEREAVREKATKALAALSEPVQDRRPQSRRGASDRPGSLFAFGPGSHEEYVDVDPSIGVLDGPAIDPFAVRLVGLFEPIDLQETSEFGTFHEVYADPTRDVSSQFGDVTDWQVSAAFAYPELVPEEATDGNPG